MRSRGMKKQPNGTHQAKMGPIGTHKIYNSNTMETIESTQRNRATAALSD